MLNISPHLASPVGEGQILLLSDYQKAINSKSNLHLPYGGEREGADVHWQSNLFLPLGKVRMGYPKGRNKLLQLVDK